MSRYLYVTEQISKLVREWKDEPYSRSSPEWYLDLIDELLKASRCNFPESYGGFKELRMWLPTYQRGAHWRQAQEGEPLYIAEPMTYEDCLAYVSRLKEGQPNLRVKVALVPEHKRHE